MLTGLTLTAIVAGITYLLWVILRLLFKTLFGLLQKVWPSKEWFKEKATTAGKEYEDWFCNLITEKNKCRKS